jgi:hypothetical protein
MQPISWPRTILDMMSIVSALQALVRQIDFAVFAQMSTLRSKRFTLARISGG